MINTTKIYLVTNCYGNPNKVYIGKTKNTRKSSHKKTYGKNIIYTYIDEIKSLNKKEWKPLEGFWIQYLKFLGFEVLNKNEDGGNGPSYYSKESKIKMGLSKKGKKHKPHPTGENHGKTGFKYNKKQKQNISNAKLGQVYPTLQKSVNQYSLNGEYIDTYPSISAANIALNKDKDIGSIGLCCKDKMKTAWGFIWKWNN
jgi:hypothetical protein